MEDSDRKFFCCPECGARYKIRLDGKKYNCKKCGEPFQTTDSFSPAPFSGPITKTPFIKKLSKSSAVISGIILLTIFLICVRTIGDSQKQNAPSQAIKSPSTGARSSAPAATPIPEPVIQPKLELRSWRWSEEYGYYNVVGEVKNISGQSMENVEIVASFYDSYDTFIKSADAMIDYNPILPGQTSPFKAMTSTNPAIKKASVQFKFLFGGRILTKGRDN